jgi:hypothetical protein
MPGLEGVKSMANKEYFELNNAELMRLRQRANDELRNLTEAFRGGDAEQVGFCESIFEQREFILNLDREIQTRFCQIDWTHGFPLPSL